MTTDNCNSNTNTCNSWSHIYDTRCCTWCRNMYGIHNTEKCKKKVLTTKIQFRTAIKSHETLLFADVTRGHIGNFQHEIEAMRVWCTCRDCSDGGRDGDRFCCVWVLAQKPRPNTSYHWLVYRKICTGEPSYKGHVVKRVQVLSWRFYSWCTRFVVSQ